MLPAPLTTPSYANLSEIEKAPHGSGNLPEMYDATLDHEVGFLRDMYEMGIDGNGRVHWNG